MTRVFIAENVPSLNKGEVAILSGIMRSIKHVDRISILSVDAETDRSRYGATVDVIDIGKTWRLSENEISSLERTVFSVSVLAKHLLFCITYRLLGNRVLRLFRSDFWRILIEADVIIIGHDGTFNIGGTNTVPIRFYPLLLPHIARLIGKKTVLYGGSIGAVKDSGLIIRASFKLALMAMDLVTVRERCSYANAELLGLGTNKLRLTADLAFLAEPAPLEALRDIESTDDAFRGPTIGITVSREIACTSFPWMSEEERYLNHVEILAAAIDRLRVSKRGVVFLIPHCLGPEESNDDRRMIRDIIELCTNKDNIFTVTRDYTPSEIMALLSKLDILIAERIHSAIEALISDTPVLMISYRNDQRLDILRRVKFGVRICNSENLSTATIFAASLELIDIHPDERAEMRYAVSEMKKLAVLNGTLLDSIINPMSIDGAL